MHYFLEEEKLNVYNVYNNNQDDSGVKDSTRSGKIQLCFAFL